MPDQEGFSSLSSADVLAKNFWYSARRDGPCKHIRKVVFGSLVSMTLKLKQWAQENTNITNTYQRETHKSTANVLIETSVV